MESCRQAASTTSGRTTTPETPSGSSSDAMFWRAAMRSCLSRRVRSRPVRPTALRSPTTAIPTVGRSRWRRTPSSAKNMSITVRTVEQADLPSWVDSLTTAFLQRVDNKKVAEDFASLWDLSRTWAAFEGDQVVGTYRSWATELTVPGGAQLPAA